MTDVIEINGECQFLKDLETAPNFGGTVRGMYNLSVTTSALRMFIKTGMKPNRGWRIKDVKEYFGITGSKDRLLEKLERIKEVMLAD